MKSEVIRTILHMRVVEEVVETKPAGKYLGIMIDYKLNFSEQMKRTAEEGEKGITNLNRLMANVSWCKSNKRRLLMSDHVICPAAVWADDVDKEVYRKRLFGVKKGVLLGLLLRTSQVLSQ